jgi:SNF2 family DNA or RNA helicase
MNTIFNYKTTPFSHQETALHLSYLKPAFALFMEQGTGKTKVVIDNVCWLFEQEEITCLIIVAPNGVHRNWITDEFPAHCWDDVDYEPVIWRAGKSGNKNFQNHFKFISRPIDQCLSVFAINIDSVITKAGRAAIKTLLQNHTCMMAVDESTDIKSPGAKRTKAMRTLGKLAAWRRILTGTPTAEKPLDLYGQFAFLEPTVFGNSYYSFKHTYAMWEPQWVAGRNRPFNALVGFKNLDMLQSKIAPYSYRITKDEALDLPPKLYTKRYFQLSKNQQMLYDSLRQNFIFEFESGETVTADMVLTRLLRLQQISCGYVPVDISEDDEPMRDIIGPNPRLDALKAVVEEAEGKIIIWTRFRKDVDILLNIYKGEAVRYDGKTTPDERADSIEQFQRGSAKLFVGSPKAGGRGLTLHAATTVIFYSNYFGLETRIQAEDRAHRIGQEHPVLYVDIVGEDTVDEKIVLALREKKRLANIITGDAFKEWI